MNHALRTPHCVLLVALLLWAVAAPSAVPAQGRGPRGPERMDRHGPVEQVLRRSAELGLTEAQVARLEAVGRAMEERNRPLVAELVRIRREMRDEPGRERRERVEEARPLMGQIRGNNRRAMEEVGEILTAEQKARLREALRRGREHHDHRSDRRGRGG